MSETPYTLLMSGLAWALGCWLLIMKWLDPNVAGADRNGDVFVAALSLIAVSGGCYMTLFTLVKKVIAFPERMLLISSFGSRKEVPWRSVTGIKVPFMTKKLTVITGEDRIAVNGAPKAYLKFIRYALTRLPSQVDPGPMKGLLQRMGQLL